MISMAHIPNEPLQFRNFNDNKWWAITQISHLNKTSLNWREIILESSTTKQHHSRKYSKHCWRKQQISAINFHLHPTMPGLLNSKTIQLTNWAHLPLFRVLTSLPLPTRNCNKSTDQHRVEPYKRWWNQSYLPCIIQSLNRKLVEISKDQGLQFKQEILA
jgi:hypothetical protein